MVLLYFTFISFFCQVGQIASLAIDEFIKLASAGYGETEFKRAKKQLQVGHSTIVTATTYTFAAESVHVKCEYFDQSVNIAFSTVNAPDELGIAARGVRGSGTTGLVQWRAKTTRILY